MKKHNLFRDLFYIFKPYWQYSKATIFALLVINSILPAIAVVGSVMYQEKIVTALSEGKDIRYILYTALWLTVIIFLPQIITSVVDMCVATLSFEKVEMHVYQDIYKKARSTDYRYFDDPEFYDNYTWTINQRVQKANQARKMIVSFFSSIVTIIAVGGVIVVQDWFIVAITVITLGIGLWIGTIENKLMYKKQEENIRPYRILGNIKRVFYDKAQSMDIKTTNVSVKLMKQFSGAYGDIFNTIKKYSKKLALFSSANFTFSAVVQILITMYLSYRVTTDAIPIGSFVGLIAASGALDDRLSQLFDFVKNSNELSLYAARLRQFETALSPIETCASTNVCESDAFDIDFRNVSFSYPNASFGVKNINIHIHKGTKIAIVGENGGGKTTLTKLLMRLYDPDSGAILINGKDIREYALRDLRDHIGLAPQLPNIYALTFRDNITLYNESVSDTELQKICDLLGLDKVLEKTNSTLDSYITKEFFENGIVMSTGETQKLALARLYTTRFGLLVLDEASSALDPIAEYELNQMLFARAANTTTIMIAHRLSNVRDADCIYLMQNGEVVESGTHEELMQKQGIYCDMFNKQSENYVKKQRGGE